MIDWKVGKTTLGGQWAPLNIIRVLQLNLGFSCLMLFVSNQMPLLNKIEADWKCTKEDLIDRPLPIRVPTAPLKTVEGP